MNPRLSTGVFLLPKFGCGFRMPMFPPHLPPCGKNHGSIGTLARWPDANRERLMMRGRERLEFVLGVTCWLICAAAMGSMAVAGILFITRGNPSANCASGMAQLSEPGRVQTSLPIPSSGTLRDVVHGRGQGHIQVRPTASTVNQRSL
jgi:hypothetical protein